MQLIQTRTIAKADAAYPLARPSVRKSKADAREASPQRVIQPPYPHADPQQLEEGGKYIELRGSIHRPKITIWHLPLQNMFSAIKRQRLVIDTKSASNHDQLKSIAAKKSPTRTRPSEACPQISTYTPSF
jgi:hypothetical protein